MVQFYVINWDVNKDCIEHYDVIPYLYSEIEKKRKREKIAKKDLTYEWLRRTIEDSSRYMYWSRCQYEVIVHAWPAYRNDHKMDIHEQIMMNLDNITELVYNDYHKIKPIKGK